MTQYNPEDYQVHDDSEEFLTRLVVDIQERTFYMYSSNGEDRVVECDTVDEFMNVLELVRSVVGDDIVHYAEPTAVEA
tara:strand:+ start:1998 stop:2231 length:234 start_codon:yes stop_codon:yes gene_type:complete